MTERAYSAKNLEGEQMLHRACSGSQVTTTKNLVYPVLIHPEVRFIRKSSRKNCKFSRRKYSKNDQRQADFVQVTRFGGCDSTRRGDDDYTRP